MKAFIILGLVCFSIIGTRASSCPRMRTRQQWGAKHPKYTSDMDKNDKPDIVVIKQAGKKCESKRRCPDAIKSVQHHDMLVDKKGDIACNFIIGSDGNVYEGTGWEKVAMDNEVIVICMLGDFDKKRPDKLQEKTLNNFLKCDDVQSKLATDYTLYGWKDLRPVDDHNPGKYMYKLVQGLPHYNEDKID